MRYTIELHTTDYRGDHAADIVLSYSPRDGESVEAMVARVLGADDGPYSRGRFLVLRPVAGEEERDGDDLHIGRSWSRHDLEDACPCPQEACGLVAMSRIEPDCPQHAIQAAKTIRQSHDAKDCPAHPGPDERKA
ncbi:MAG: hypothetical protein WC565_03115 [Parcubacteria group bacterium]